MLLPAGHLENENHFQDRPAKGGQKFDRKKKIKKEAGVTPLPPAS